MCDCDAFLKRHEIFIIDHHISCSVQREANADTCARHGLSVRTLCATPPCCPSCKNRNCSLSRVEPKRENDVPVVYGTMNGPGDFSKDAVF